MDKYSREEKEKQLLRNFDLGEGVSVTIQDGDKTNYFFTNKVEGVKAKSKQSIGDLEVEMSSTQADEEQLLKKLHSSL